MWDRRFLFSDDKVIERLSKDFVPFAGNTHLLQSGASAARDWFMRAATRLRPELNESVSAQGFYVVGADGSAFGYHNVRSVDRVLSLLKNGAKAFEAAHVKAPKIDDAAVADANDRRQPAGTSVLRLFARIQPFPEGCDPSNENVSQDHFWLLKEEVQSLIGTDSWPDKAISRFFRFALVDHVRGEPEHWRVGEVKTAIIDFKRIMEFDGKITYKVSGRFDMATPDGARGLEGTLAGRFQVERKAARVTECRIYVDGTAWGSSRFTPNPPPGKVCLDVPCICTAC